VLGSTEVLEYHNQGERLDWLRVQITEARESLAAIAREAKIDRRTLQRFANQGATLHESTIEKLEAVVRRLRLANRRSLLAAMNGAATRRTRSGAATFGQQE
jgi:hypothetical protein